MLAGFSNLANIFESYMHADLTFWKNFEYFWDILCDPKLEFVFL